jgi:hypothetical protein
MLLRSSRILLGGNQYERKSDKGETGAKDIGVANGWYVGKQREYAQTR